MARATKPTQPKKAPPQKDAVTSTLRFDVQPGLPEIQDYARQQGWLDKGWTEISIPWQELVYTADGWKTVNTLKSSAVPSPLVGGSFVLPGVPAGTEIEFALHVGVSSHAPSDAGDYRERGDVWLNNGGKNYRQLTT